MQFTDEHKALASNVKNFAQNEIKPFVEDWEKNGHFPAHDLFKKMGNFDKHVFLTQFPNPKPNIDEQSRKPYVCSFERVSNHQKRRHGDRDMVNLSLGPTFKNVFKTFNVKNAF